MARVMLPGAAGRNALDARFRKAKRFLDDHGEPLPEARIRTVWTRGRVGLVVSAAALAVLNGVLAAIIGHHGGLVFVFLPVSVGVLVGAMVTRRTELLPWVATGLALVYLLEKTDGDPNIQATAAYAVVLLLVLELVFASVDRGTGVTWERSAAIRQWLMRAGLVAVSAAAALVVGMVGSAGRFSGAALFGFGVASALLALFVVVRFVGGSVRSVR